MKKILTVFMTLFVCFWLIGVGHAYTISSVFSGDTVAASGSTTSDAIKITEGGDIGIQYDIDGSDNCTLSYIMSFDSSTFLTPSNSSSVTITENFDCSSTTDYIYEISPVFTGGWIKFVFTNNNSTDAATVNNFIVFEN